MSLVPLFTLPGPGDPSWNHHKYVTWRGLFDGNCFFGVSSTCMLHCTVPVLQSPTSSRLDVRETEAT